MKAPYKRYYRYLSQGDINVQYLQRTPSSLMNFLIAWRNGWTIREKYIESEPGFISIALHLKAEQKIPKYLVPTMYALATRLQCRLVWVELISGEDITKTYKSVKIIGHTENAELLHHLLKRVVVDMIDAKPILIEKYKQKNKHLFGKQKRPEYKAKQKLIQITQQMEKILEVHNKDEFTYHRLCLKTIERRVKSYFRIEGKIGPKQGFSKNKMIKQ